MFSKSGQYTIRAVLYLAAHSEEGRKLGVKEIAEALEVPKHFLAKILQQLARHGLISSTKGPSGGFYLSEANLRQPLRTIIENVDGPDLFSSCVLGFAVCSSKNPCPLHHQVIEYRKGLLELIEKKTIREVSIQVTEKSLKI